MGWAVRVSAVVCLGVACACQVPLGCTSSTDGGSGGAGGGGGGGLLPPNGCRRNADCDAPIGPLCVADHCIERFAQHHCSVFPTLDCTDDADCDNGNLCSSCGGGLMACRAPCTGAADCWPGAHCDGTGHCSAATCAGGPDCPPTFDCSNGECVPRPCTSDDACAGGFCVLGFCSPEAGRCDECSC